MFSGKFKLEISSCYAAIKRPRIHIDSNLSLKSAEHLVLDYFFSCDKSWPFSGVIGDQYQVFF